MTAGLRDFGLEVFFSEWEFSARHHMTASDFESMSLQALLGFASEDDRARFDDLWLGYTETWGAPDLRAAIAATYDTMQPANVLCHAGAGEAIYALARVLLGPEDHVIVPTPNYQSAETVPLAICAVTGVPMRREVWPSNGDSPEWRLDLDDVRAAIRPNTRLISINFPHNPTGAVIARGDLEALVEMCRARGIYLLSDEVYRGVELDAAHALPQVADLYERGISLNVMSKAYGLPGLRIGWIASPDAELLQRVERYKHFLSICNSAPSERLAVIALGARDAIFARNTGLMRRNLGLLQALFDDFPGLVEYHAPQGGCVAFPKFVGPGGGEAFCEALRAQSGIIVLPSSVYGSEVAEVPADHFRIGMGRDQVVVDGIAAMRAHFQTHFAAFAR